jgi:hypothetical protein
MTTVSTWLCKCGAFIEAVGERDGRGESKTVIAACPECGETKKIHTDKILSITADKPMD